MFGKKFKCTLIGKDWATPTVLRLSFSSNRRIRFRPGQFLSIKIAGNRNEASEWRCYSFANSPEHAAENGYEIYVKIIAGGRGSEFLQSLKPGDSFLAKAPFGKFGYQHNRGARTAVFIGTGTGLAPIRSILQSIDFRRNRPEHVLLLSGFRTAEEVLYAGEFNGSGIETMTAVSRANKNWMGTPGRVTDLVAALPPGWDWSSAEFYLCGSGEMVEEVRALLVARLGVSPDRIHSEAFTHAKRLILSGAPLRGIALKVSA